MQADFEKVKGFLWTWASRLYPKTAPRNLVVISKQDSGIVNLIVDCEDVILIMEQAIMPIPKDRETCFTELLKMNRYLLHGAFVLVPDSNSPDPVEGYAAAGQP